MAVTPEQKQRLKAIAEQATQGPWAWHVNTRSRDVYLYAQAPMRPLVMDFARCGMQSAQPRFRTQPLEIMEPMVDCLPHPDAQHIALASPETVLALLAEIEQLRVGIEAIHAIADDPSSNHEEAVADDGHFVICHASQAIVALCEELLK